MGLYDQYETWASQRYVKRWFTNSEGVTEVPADLQGIDQQRAWFKRQMSAETAGQRFWTRLAANSEEEFKKVAMAGGRATVGAGMRGLGRSWATGFASAYYPIDISEMGAMSGVRSAVGRAVGGGATRGALGGLARTAFKWMGPVMTAYRLGSEVPGAGGPVAGADKAVRILGEEGMRMGGALAGMQIGAALGSVVPVAGTIVGAVAGMAIGYGLGEAGAGVWNTAVDVGEAPLRAGAAAWKFFGDLGRRSKRPDLGGQISRGNQTRFAATMRQRALMEINRSGINARSVLGREAQYLNLH